MCPSKTFYENKLGEVTSCFAAEPLTMVTGYAQEKLWKQRPGANAKDMGWDCLISGSLLECLELPATMRAEPQGAVTLRGHEHETEIFALSPAML